MRSFARTAMGVAFASAAFAQAITFATFADPTIGMTNPTPMFFLVPPNANGTLTGGWAGTGLTLITHVGNYTDVTFTMTQVSTTLVVAGFFATGSGTVQFATGTDPNLFRIDFQSGAMAPNGFGGADFWGDNVVFSGTLVTGGPWSGEAFGFAFANPTPAQGGITYTASFTSSAVPEPATFGALALGLIALAARRRRR